MIQSIKRKPATAEMLRAKIEAFKRGWCPITHAVEMAWPNAEFDDFQLDIIGSMVLGMTPKLTEMGIKGCTGAGKGGAVAAGANLWYAATGAAKIYITSQSYDHAKDTMFKEFIKWWNMRAVKVGGTTSQTGVRCDEGKFVKILSPGKTEGFSGAHGPATLIIFDEASVCRDDYYEQAKTQAALIVALSNPRVLSGWFWRMFPLDDPDTTQTIKIPGGSRRLITIGAPDCRNVQEGVEVIPSQITRETFEAIKASPDPRFVQVMGYGRFPGEDPEKQVILPSWIRRHQSAWKKGLPVDAYGLDVGGSRKGDPSVLAAGSGVGVTKLHSRTDDNLMALVRWVLKTSFKEHGIDLTKDGVPICVDTDGIGLGVADRLEEKGVVVIRHIGNKPANDARRYTNWRTESYGNLGARLDPDGAWGNQPFALPGDGQLAEELCAPEKVYGSDELRFGITPKKKSGTHKGDTIQQKIGRSPDKGDAVVYLYRAICELERLGRWRSKMDHDMAYSGGEADEPLTEEERQDMSDELRELIDTDWGSDLDFEE